MASTQLHSCFHIGRMVASHITHWTPSIATPLPDPDGEENENDMPAHIAPHETTSQAIARLLSNRILCRAHEESSHINDACPERVVMPSRALKMALPMVSDTGRAASSAGVAWRSAGYSTPLYPFSRGERRSNSSSTYSINMKFR